MRYKVGYISGNSLRYKERIVDADSEEEAVKKVFDAEGSNFENDLESVKVLETDDIELMFKIAEYNETDELDFYMDFLKKGYVLDDLMYDEERYNHTKEFMIEHGLMDEPEDLSDNDKDLINNLSKTAASVFKTYMVNNDNYEAFMFKLLMACLNNAGLDKDLRKKSYNYVKVRIKPERNLRSPLSGEWYFSVYRYSKDGRHLYSTADKRFRIPAMSDINKAINDIRMEYTPL